MKRAGGQVKCAKCVKETRIYCYFIQQYVVQDFKAKTNATNSQGKKLSMRPALGLGKLPRNPGTVSIPSPIEAIGPELSFKTTTAPTLTNGLNYSLSILDGIFPY